MCIRDSFRRNHLIRFTESIKIKQSIVTFLKNDRFYVYPMKFTGLKIFTSNSLVAPTKVGTAGKINEPDNKLRIVLNKSCMWS